MVKLTRKSPKVRKFQEYLTLTFNIFTIVYLFQTSKLRQILLPDSQFEIPKYENVSYDSVPSKVILQSQGLNIGDRVMVGDSKVSVAPGVGTHLKLWRP